MPRAYARNSTEENDMPKADLDKCYSYRHPTKSAWGPGKNVEIPQGLYDRLVAAGVIGGKDDGGSGAGSIFDEIPTSAAEALRAAGFATEGDLRDATEEELRAVEGVGDATIKKIRESG